MRTLQTRCCIAGGGPAGMMLGLLLARAGVQVTVLEKHADFLRDFRGDTVHPSTLEVLHELGLLSAFLQRPHDKAWDLRVSVGGQEATVADFRRLNARCGFIAMVPQWEFLDFLRDEAERRPNFRLLLQARAHALVENGERVTGVQVETADGPLEVRAGLVVAADGRHSALRAAAGLQVQDLGAPIDVLWMRVARHPGDPAGSGGRIGTGRFVAMIDRGSYWQCAYVIPKGSMEALRARGLPRFRAELAAVVPFFAGRLEGDLADWDAIKLLSVRVDRLAQWWKPGVLFIGDAAHAMSPIGGVGINLAVQDAVAAANILAAPLSDARVTDFGPWLQRVQQRRLWPARVTQAMQVAAQNRLINPLLDATQPPRLPWLLKVLQRFPALQALPAHAIGIGVRPEHVRSAQQAP